MMKRFSIYEIFYLLLAALFLLPGPAAAQSDKAPASVKKPRIAILNLVPRVIPIDPKTGLPRGLPRTFRNIDEFEVADRILTEKLIDEWSRAAIFSQLKRGQKLGRLYDVQLMVAGKVHAIKKQKWVISFVQLNAPPEAPGREKSVASRSEFYSILDENDPVIGPVLADLAGVFGFRTSVSAKNRRKRLCDNAIAGDDVKSILVDKTLVVLEQFYVRFRADGVWEASTDPDDLDERGKWWMEGKRLCETVPNVQKPPCRCLKQNKDGGYKFLWEGGSEQFFRIQ